MKITIQNCSMYINKTNLINFLLTFCFIFKVSAQNQDLPEVKDPKAKQTAPVSTKKALPVHVIKSTTKVPVDGRDARKVIIDEAATAIEDSTRLAAEEEILADNERNKLRKRIFGYQYFNTSKFDPTPVLNIATPNNYVLGTNDQLNIDLYGIYQDRFTTTISPDGYIRIEKGGIGLIYVMGLTIEQARERIVNRLSKAYVALKGVNPQATATISLGNIRSIKVNILGEVVAPGTYTMPSLATILNALYQCGGPNEIGSFRKIQLIRQNRVVANFDFYDVLLNGFSKQNLLLQDQDIIKVPAYSNRVVIQGAVKRSLIFELEPAEKLDKLIEYAGGYNPKAYTNRLNVYRNTEKEKKILDVLKADITKFSVEDGDSVVVNEILERYENRIIIEGAVFRPGEYSVSENKTLLALIKSAEGLKDEAMTGRVSIERKNADMTLENLSVNLSEIINGRASDVSLQREDIITISSMFDLTEAAIVRIQGAINNVDNEIGIEYPYVRNMTVEDLIIKSGGLKESVALSKIEIVRRKRNVDPGAVNAQISDIYEVSINPNLNVNSQGSKFNLEPYDEVFVRNSPNYQVQQFSNIEGEIFYPGKYGIKSKEEKISDLINRAGGLTPQAYIEGATLLRKVVLSEFEIEQRRKNLVDLNQTIGRSTEANGLANVEDVDQNKKDAIGIDLKTILANPGSFDDMILQDGDVLRIPKRLETVRIQGEVLYPITVKYQNGLRLNDYISKSGGFTNRSLKRKTFVLYANGSVDRTKKLLFFNVYPKIEPGSEIIVPSKGGLLTPTQNIQKFQAVVATITGTISGLLTLLGILEINKLNKKQ
jgi:protein involved in polysaccharide export with SLBB domain